MSHSTTAARYSGGSVVEGALHVVVEVAVLERALRASPAGRATAYRSASSPMASMRMRCRRRAWSRNRLVVMRCSQPSNVPGRVRVQRPEHADERLLREVLGVVLVAR